MSRHRRLPDEPAPVRSRAAHSAARTSTLEAEPAALRPQPSAELLEAFTAPVPRLDDSGAVRSEPDSGSEQSDPPATDADGDGPTRRRTAGARRRPPSAFHRMPVVLAALVVGALMVLLPATSGSSPQGTDALAGAPYGIGGDNAAGLSDDGQGTARKELSASEAKARLDDLRASRNGRDVPYGTKWVKPINGAVLTTCFCMRWGVMHEGVDLAAPLGTPIYAAGDGVVLKAGPASGFGNAIYIQHENGDVSIYGHEYVVEVKAGDIVHAGDEIAKVGTEGYSTGPHLHFEVHVGGMQGKPTDPIPWLKARGVTVP